MSLDVLVAGEPAFVWVETPPGGYEAVATPGGDGTVEPPGGDGTVEPPADPGASATADAEPPRESRVAGRAAGAAG
ncbi:MAG: hypothetical protein ABEH47_03955 [Haloferacaceae archaeon]